MSLKEQILDIIGFGLFPEVADIMAERILELPNIIEWVSVDDVLPPKGSFVLAYYPEGNESNHKVDTTTYHGGKLTDTGSSVAHCFEATHWAMLPGEPLN